MKFLLHRTVMRVICLLTLAIFSLRALPQTASTDMATSSTATGSKKTTGSSKSAKPQSAGTTSDADIAAAKAAGKVWVNLDSGIYHKGGRWYGKTKNGKFMTESEAKSAGYKESHRN